MEAVSAKLQADLAEFRNEQEGNTDRITQMERFCDRLRASNTYGEPIVRFNEDSATIS